MENDNKKSSCDSCQLSKNTTKDKNHIDNLIGHPKYGEDVAKGQIWNAGNQNIPAYELKAEQQEVLNSK